MNKPKHTYRITSPTGEIFIETRLFKFCKEHGLNPSCMWNTAVGRHNRKHHKGWKIKIIDDEINRNNYAVTCVAQSTINKSQSKCDSFLYDTYIKIKNEIETGNANNKENSKSNKIISRIRSWFYTILRRKK